MHECNNCCGHCGGCGELILTEAELALLEQLAQTPFLPLYGAPEAPVYAEDSRFSREDYTSALLCLQKRELISLDPAMPLKGCPAPGSFALTHRGQKLLEQLELQGLLP